MADVLALASSEETSHVPSPRIAHEVRIIEAAHRCFGRWGITKTTVDDIAREAGLSRATVYRAFPEGRDSIHEAVMEGQRRGFFRELGGVLAEASGLEELLVEGMATAWARLAGDEVLAFLVAHEPEIVLRNLAFERLEALIAVCRESVAPFLLRWLDDAQAARLAEWATRIVVSYAIAPPDWAPLPARGADIESWARQLAETVVRTFLAPVLQRWGVLPGAARRGGGEAVAPNSSTHVAMSARP